MAKDKREAKKKLLQSKNTDKGRREKKRESAFEVEADATDASISLRSPKKLQRFCGSCVARSRRAAINGPE